MKATLMTARGRGSSLPVLFGSRKARQQDALKMIVTKHIQEPSLADMVTAQDVAPTSTERGISYYEHSHLVSALDVINSYQRDRRARTTIHLMGCRASMRRQYKADPRTRLIELLKRWMRTTASNKNIDEDELRSMSGLCRDILAHQELFPPRNQRSFLRAISEVYNHLQLQLREVLERDRTCAELAERIISLSKNLLSDVIVYLLLAPTDLKQTDKIASLEIVSLWQSLPSSMNPLPSRVDPMLQKEMKSVWVTRCGAVIAAIVSAPWSARLFEGKGAEEEVVATTSAAAHDAGVATMLAEMRAEFEEGRFKESGLTGVLRGKGADARMARESYLKSLEAVYDLVYLLGEAFVHFHRISDGLGDYGMIRVQPWLHPFLQALLEKMQKVQANVNKLNEFLEKSLVIARARGQKPAAPTPSARMCERAHNAIARAMTNRACHAQSLLEGLEDLRGRSAPERLPHLVGSLGDACVQLQMVMNSEEFRARVGDDFPVLPALPGPAAARNLLSVCDVATSFAFRDADPTLEDESMDEDDYVTRASPGAPTIANIDLNSRDPAPIETLNDLNPFQERSVGLNPSLQAPPVLLASTARSMPAEKCSVSLNPFAEHADESGPSNPFEDDAMSTNGADDTLKRFDKQEEPGGQHQQEQKQQQHWADVYRLVLTLGGNGWRRHDRRSLLLSNKSLIIYNKGSKVDVKSEVDVQMIRTCSQVDDRGRRVLRLVFWRPILGDSDGTGVACPKDYAFEFDTAEEATAFHEQIARLRCSTTMESC
jgi:hypothetical protein